MTGIASKTHKSDKRTAMLIEASSITFQEVDSVKISASIEIEGAMRHLSTALNYAARDEVHISHVRGNDNRTFGELSRDLIHKARAALDRAEAALNLPGDVS